MALGGRLAWQGQLAAGLRRETGCAVTSGLTLEAAALVDVAVILLRWRGRDPARARAVVVSDPRAPESAEGVTEYLGERVGKVGVCGLDGLRRLTLADRMRATSGAALEVFRTADGCLVAADLLVLCGGQAPPGPPATFSGSGAPAPAMRTAVIADLCPGQNSAGAWGRGSVLRLAGPRPAAGRLVLAERPADYPLRLGRVLFGAPARWEGRPEPGLPAGLLSAPLVEAVALAAESVRGRRLAGPGTTRSSAGSRPPSSWRSLGSRTALQVDRMEWLRRRTAELGFHPAAVTAFGPDPTFLDSPVRPPI